MIECAQHRSGGEAANGHEKVRWVEQGRRELWAR
jgi:hypothetical protein